MGAITAFFIEIRDGSIRNSSYEAATVARKIASETGTKAVGIAVGSDIWDGLNRFGDYGIPEVVSVDDPDLLNYNCEGYNFRYTVIAT